MDSRHNRENWHQPMQIQLSEKRNFFFQFFPAFLKSTWNSEHFENKDGPHSFQISEINDSERCGYIISKRPCFRTLFDRQRLKVSQTLLKPAWQQFYLIFHNSERNGAWKHLSESYLKSPNWLLTHWLPMTSIFVIKGTTDSNQLKCIYLKNEKSFLDISAGYLKST